MVFLVAENENRQLEDLPQADFGRVHENISFVGKEKVNNWEFCEKKATPIVCFCNGSTHFFHLESYRQCALRLLFWRIVKPIISFFKKTTFLPRKGLLCLHDKQNNRWSLADMELLFSCLSRYQEIITVYTLLLFYSFAALTHEITSWTFEEKFQIKAHPSIILYLLNEEKIAAFVIQPQYKIH